MLSNVAFDKLTPFDSLYPFFTKQDKYYNGGREIDKEQFVKVYNDGGHYVALPRCRSKRSSHSRPKKSELDIFFDYVFLTGVRNDLRREKLSSFIIDSFIDKFGELDGLQTYVERMIERKWANFYKRLKTFKRKARLNKWNYFVTITYDDKKQTAETFRTKLKKCLANLHSRRGWKYMGVFELAPETKRLHFHAIMYIPQGEMVGLIEEKKDYSTSQHKMQTTFCNSFFAETFGRNDFKALTDNDIKKGRAIEYLTKYLSKTFERVFYSRGIPTEVLMKIKYEDVATVMFNYVNKFILFDDVVDWERDVLKIPKRKKVLKQMFMFG